MFLDDQLYLITKCEKISSAEDYVKLVNKLFKAVEDYFKPKLSATMTYAEGAALMDKTFKLWDMFISKLEKENWFLVDVLKKSSYKEHFMANPKLEEIYKRVKMNSYESLCN